jgi:hypothetical protein
MPHAGNPNSTSAERPPLPATGSGILRMGLWNYFTLRWAPKNPAARLAVEIGILVVFFGLLAVLYMLALG